VAVVVLVLRVERTDLLEVAVAVANFKQPFILLLVLTQ
jgi:hypothetical protein